MWHLVQVGDGLGDEDGGVLLGPHPALTLGHAGELARPGPDSMQCKTSGTQIVIFQISALCLLYFFIRRNIKTNLGISNIFSPSCFVPREKSFKAY